MAGSTDLELNGVPVRNAAPLPVKVMSSSGTAADASDADADADFTKTLIGGLSNSRLAGWDSTATDWKRLETNTAGGSAGLSPVRQRLLVDAQARGVEKGGTVDHILALRDDPATAGSALGVIESRATGFWASLRGRKYVVTSEGGAITVTNGFTATTPRLTIECGATKELMVRKIKLSCLLAGTTNLQYRIVIDPDARYSSGGTAVTLGARTNMNGGDSTVAGFTAHYGAITATATDADEREIEYGTIVNVTGNSIEITFDDGLIIPASGTLLLYLMDAGGVATIAANVQLEECNVQ